MMLCFFHVKLRDPSSKLESLLGWTLVTKEPCWDDIKRFRMWCIQHYIEEYDKYELTQVVQLKGKQIFSQNAVKPSPDVVRTSNGVEYCHTTLGSFAWHHGLRGFRASGATR